MKYCFLLRCRLGTGTGTIREAEHPAKLCRASQAWTLPRTVRLHFACQRLVNEAEHAFIACRLRLSSLALRLLRQARACSSHRLLATLLFLRTTIRDSATTSLDS